MTTSVYSSMVRMYSMLTPLLLHVLVLWTYFPSVVCYCVCYCVLSCINYLFNMAEAIDTDSVSINEPQKTIDTAKKNLEKVE